MSGYYQFESSGFDEARRAAVSSLQLSDGSPSGQRYASDPRNQGFPDREPAKPPLDAEDTIADNWQANVDLAKRGGKVAAFAMERLAFLQDAAKRAITDGDEAALGGIVAEIDGFVKDNYTELKPWTKLRFNGKQGEAVSELVQSAVDGTYKTSDKWSAAAPGLQSGQLMTITGFLDQNSEAYRARKAARVSREMNVDLGVARAMTDRTDERFALYGRFGDLTAAQVSSGDPQKDMVVRKLRDARKFMLADTVELDRKYGSRFGDYAAMDQFSQAFEQSFTDEGKRIPARSTLFACAEGYLAQAARQDAVSPAEYVARFKDASDSVKQALIPYAGGTGKDGKPASPLKSRMSTFEADSLVAAAERVNERLGGRYSVDDPVVVSNLAKAADKVHKASEILGIDFRDTGSRDFSRRVAEMAYKSFGAVGADDDGLGDLINSMESRVIPALCSSPTVSALVQMQGSKGTVDAKDVAVPNHFMYDEQSLVRSVGGAIWNVMQAKGIPFSDVMKRVEDGDMTVVEPVRDAMVKSLSLSMNDELARKVAGDMLPNLYGGVEGKQILSLEDSIRKNTGIFDPVKPKEPDIPPEYLLSKGGKGSAGGESDRYSGKDIEVLLSGKALLPHDDSFVWDEETQTSRQPSVERLNAAQAKLGSTIQKHNMSKDAKEPIDYSVDYQKAIAKVYLSASRDDLVFNTSPGMREAFEKGLVGKLLARDNASFSQEDISRLRRAGQECVDILRTENTEIPVGDDSDAAEEFRRSRRVADSAMLLGLLMCSSTSLRTEDVISRLPVLKPSVPGIQSRPPWWSRGYQTDYSFIGRMDYGDREYDRAKKALAAAGFVVPDGDTIPDRTAFLGALKQTLDARGMKSDLLESGFINAKDNFKLDTKGMLVKMQKRSYADPAKTDRPGDAPTPLQLEARRVLASRIGGNDLYAVLTSDYGKHLASYGITGNELVNKRSLFADRIAKADKTGGQTAVYNLYNDAMQQAPRFVPREAIDSFGNRILDPVNFTYVGMLNDAQWKVQREKTLQFMRDRSVRGTEDMTADDLDLMSADGYSRMKEMDALQLDMLKRGKSSQPSGSNGL